MTTGDNAAMSRFEWAIIAQQADEVPEHGNQQWETDRSAIESETFIADGEEETFEHRGDEAEEETEDVAAEREESIFERKEDSPVVTGPPRSAEEEIEIVPVADKIQNIESAVTSSATAAGSVEATSGHTDEEGESEVRAAE